MGAIRPPKRAKLFTGILCGVSDLFALTRRRLVQHFGEVELESPRWAFTDSDYYETELGTEVERQFLFFRELVSVERLSEIKRLTNDLERRIAEDVLLPECTRPVNIDPGYITISKLVLATTKDAAHRIYVQHGIYAEVTLRFECGGWLGSPWTYPDYAADRYHASFTQARESLKASLSDLGPPQ